jgi:hypothetical protein
MRAQGVAHEHRSLHFRVRLASGDQVKYDPALITRRGPIMFLIEPLEASEEEPRRIELLAAFLEQHSPEIVLIVVTTGERLAGLPVSSYDEAYASEDLAGVVRRIRAQDPRGMIRPFPKPRA